MKRRGPLLTLAAAAVLGIVLLLINISKEDEPAKPAAAAQTSSVAPSATDTPPPATSTPAAPAAIAFPANANYEAEIPTATGVITLSITVEGDKAVAYACDGAKIETWLKGSAVNGVLDLTGKDSKLDGRHDGSKVTGTLVIGEKSWPYEAAQVQPPAGLYVYKDGDTRASWIVSSDGSVTGVQRGPNGATSAAPGLKDGTAVIDGKTVTATQVSGADQNAF